MTDASNNFHPTEILIYSASIGSTAGEFIDLVYEKEDGVPRQPEEEKKKDL